MILIVPTRTNTSTYLYCIDPEKKCHVENGSRVVDITLAHPGQQGAEGNGSGDRMSVTTTVRPFIVVLFVFTIHAMLTVSVTQLQTTVESTFYQEET